MITPERARYLANLAGQAQRTAALAAERVAMDRRREAIERRDPCAWCGVRADLHGAKGCARWVPGLVA